MRRAVLLSALAALSWRVAYGARPITPPAPEFPRGQSWVNSKELTLEQLRKRRVVVVSFINFSSLNSIRSIPVLKGWWDRYSLDGLMVIGVHTPDYDFDRDPPAVRSAVKRFGIRFPVILDNDRALWKAYQNEGWPAYYLVDHQGRILHDRLGEGGYREFEKEILQALERFNGYWPKPGAKLAEDPPAKDCRQATALIRLGARRGRQISLTRARERDRYLLSSRNGETAYRGRWTVEPDALRLERDNPGQSDFLRLIYRGAEAGVLMTHNESRPTQVFVKQDEMWLHAQNAGPDVLWDVSDRSFILVSEPRIYYVSKNPDDNMHELYLYPSEAGVGIHAFEFSNACQTLYEHR